LEHLVERRVVVEEVSKRAVVAAEVFWSRHPPATGSAIHRPVARQREGADLGADRLAEGDFEAIRRQRAQVRMVPVPIALMMMIL
jgi:hypothetical protein